jgi:hypothetical protein
MPCLTFRSSAFMRYQSFVSISSQSVLLTVYKYKRQQMNIFGVIHRYLKLKEMTPAERKETVPRVSIFGGKAAPGYWMVSFLVLFLSPVSI